MIVTILKKHGSAYMEINCCPLYNAIKESYPEIPLRNVGGTGITLDDGTERKILTSFCSLDIDRIQKGKIDKLEVEIDMDTVYGKI